MSQFIAQNKRAFTHRDTEAFKTAEDMHTRANNSSTYTHREAFGFADGEIIDIDKRDGHPHDATVLRKRLSIRDLLEKLEASRSETTSGIRYGDKVAIVKAAPDAYTTWDSCSELADFHGAKLEESIQHAKAGWDAGLKKMFAALDDIKAMGGISKVPDAVQDVAGDEPNIAAYSAGQPENMTRYEWPETETERVTVRISYGASGDVSPQTLIYRGAAVVHAVEVLEAAGIGVEIICDKQTKGFVEDSTGRKPYLQTITKIKEAGQRPNIARITFALAHPDMLRRLSFANREQLPIGVGAMFKVNAGSYGSSTNDLKNMPLSNNPTVFIGALDAWNEQKYDTAERAARTVAKTFSEAGFNLETNQ